MLDPIVGQTLTRYQAGQISLEDAAQALLAVRRRTGCLRLMTPPGADDRQQALVTRFTALAAEEFGGNS